MTIVNNFFRLFDRQSDIIYANINNQKIFSNSNPSSLDETPFEFIVIQNIGLNTLIFRLYTTNMLKATIDEIVRFKVIHLLKSLSIGKDRINNLLEEILNFEKDIQFDLIDYFEVKLRE